MDIELEDTKKLLESAQRGLEREKRERMEEKTDFKEFLSLANNDIQQMVNKIRYAADPSAALTTEMAAIRKGRRDDSETSLSGLGLSNNGNEVDGCDGECFPFLDLPDEVLSLIFSFMPMEDRLQARVNKRLDQIELKCKYHVDKMCIHEISEYHTELKNCSWFSGIAHHMCFIKYDRPHSHSYSSDGIKRLTQNVSIGWLDVHVTESSDFRREVYNVIKDFDIGRLVLRPNVDNDYGSVLCDSYFLNLTRACKEIITVNMGSITAAGLHQAYKGMIEGSIKLRMMRAFILKDECVPFLELIGITHEYGISSNRNIELFEPVDENVRRTYIFDGNLEISLDHDILYSSDECGYFSLKLHESQESLENAKN